jgi:hypothetical protein
VRFSCDFRGQRSADNAQNIPLRRALVKRRRDKEKFGIPAAEIQLFKQFFPASGPRP